MTPTPDPVLVNRIHDALCEQRAPHGTCDQPDAGHTMYDAAAAVEEAGWSRHNVLVQLRDKGNSRRDRWHTPDTVPWLGVDWSNAMGGEVGEAQNVVKKLRRLETGTGSQDGKTHDELVTMLANELADVVAYADLLAQHYGLDLSVCIAQKFNAVSIREGFPERIEVAP